MDELPIIEKLLNYYYKGPQDCSLFEISQFISMVLDSLKEEMDCIYEYSEHIRDNYRHRTDINDQELSGFVGRTLKLLGFLRN